jgi:PAS domain S-box-containing protein
MPPERQPSRVAHARLEWRQRLRSGEIRRLFEHVPGTLFFAKNAAGEIMMGNRQFVERCGFKSEDELIGRHDQEIFPPHMAEKYREDDLQVIRTGEPLLQIVELFPNRHGDPEWFITDKLPLFDIEGSVCGVCGIVRSYEGARRVLQPYLELAPVADYIKAHCGEPISVRDLAKMAGLSVRQFERNFLSTFRTTPKHYIMRLRVLLACDQLLETRRSITEIALGVGFCDHSAFARHFRKQLGVSPRAYREKYLANPAPNGLSSHANRRAPRKI